MSDLSVDGAIPVWYSSRRGFRLGVLGPPDDKGNLSVQSAMSRWVLIEQTDADGSVRKAYLAPAGFGRHPHAARKLCERLQGDVPSPVKPILSC